MTFCGLVNTGRKKMLYRLLISCQIFHHFKIVKPISHTVWAFLGAIVAPVTSERGTGGLQTALTTS